MTTVNITRLIKHRSAADKGTSQQYALVIAVANRKLPKSRQAAELNSDVTFLIKSLNIAILGNTGGVQWVIGSIDN